MYHEDLSTLPLDVYGRIQVECNRRGLRLDGETILAGAVRLAELMFDDVEELICNITTEELYPIDMIGELLENILNPEETEDD